MSRIKPLNEIQFSKIQKTKLNDISVEKEIIENINKNFDELNEKNKKILNKINLFNKQLKNYSSNKWDLLDIDNESSLFNFYNSSIFETYFENIIPKSIYFAISKATITKFIYNNIDKIEILNMKKNINIMRSVTEKQKTRTKKEYIDNIYNFEMVDVINDDYFFQNYYFGAFKLTTNENNNVIFIHCYEGYTIYSIESLTNNELNWLYNELSICIEKSDKTENENMNYIFSDEVGRLYTNEFKIEKADIDIDLQYNDDFKPVNDVIVKSLTEKDKGVIILSGEMGTGKTYYIRWLTKNVDKKFIYVPRYFYTGLSSTSFFSFLLSSCKNSILIFEDAEEIVKSRDSDTGNYLISDILEMSDGLLNDVLRVQMIFTFNTEVENIDKALLRPSRLLAKYEFNKLSVDKTNKLLKHLNKNMVVDVPKTLAEIYNADDMPIIVNKKDKSKFGF